MARSLDEPAVGGLHHSRIQRAAKFDSVEGSRRARLAQLRALAHCLGTARGHGQHVERNRHREGASEKLLGSMAGCDRRWDRPAGRGRGAVAVAASAGLKFWQYWC